MQPISNPTLVNARHGSRNIPAESFLTQDTNDTCLLECFSRFFGEMGHINPNTARLEKTEV